mmetsp:Transcript_100879/g.284594  ORF Transcript_100879/g.284594 Transcript_100879/m.284594 type:complete len:384 (+) Transcript_100879:208-1359(+)
MPTSILLCSAILAPTPGAVGVTKNSWGSSVSCAAEASTSGGGLAPINSMDAWSPHCPVCAAGRATAEQGEQGSEHPVTSSGASNGPSGLSSPACGVTSPLSAMGGPSFAALAARKSVGDSGCIGALTPTLAAAMPSGTEASWRSHGGNGSHAGGGAPASAGGRRAASKHNCWGPDSPGHGGEDDTRSAPMLPGGRVRRSSSVTLFVFSATASRPLGGDCLRASATVWSTGFCARRSLGKAVTCSSGGIPVSWPSWKPPRGDFLKVAALSGRPLVRRSKQRATYIRSSTISETVARLPPRSRRIASMISSKLSFFLVFMNSNERSSSSDSSSSSFVHLSAKRKSLKAITSFAFTPKRARTMRKSGLRARRSNSFDSSRRSSSMS